MSIGAAQAAAAARAPGTIAPARRRPFRSRRRRLRSRRRPWGFAPSLRPVALLDRLAHAGQRLDAVAGVEARRVDLVREPRPARQAVRRASARARPSAGRRWPAATSASRRRRPRRPAPRLGVVARAPPPRAARPRSCSGAKLKAGTGSRFFGARQLLGRVRGQPRRRRRRCAGCARSSRCAVVSASFWTSAT